MDPERFETLLMQEQGRDCDSHGRLSHHPAPILRRPRPTSRHLDHLTQAATALHFNRDWATQSKRPNTVNPNRFSDPLNHAGLSRLLPTSLHNTLNVPGRPNKAYSWYLDNGLPWGQRSRASHDSTAQGHHSLFANAEPCKNPDAQFMFSVSAAEDSRSRISQSGVSNTWERVRRNHHGGGASRSSYRLSHTWDSRQPESSSTSISNTFSFSQRGGGHPHPSQWALGSPLSSQRSSPGSSQRSSPCLSPQGSLKRLSPASTMVKYGPGSRLSPTQLHSVFSSNSLGRQSHGARPSHSAVTSRSPFASPWASHSSSPVFQLSPFSTSPASSVRGGDESFDVSYGSETDDDFFYVSCRQMTQGLADLAMSSASQNLPTSSKQYHAASRGDHVVVNPNFGGVRAGGGGYPIDAPEDDELELDYCSDDALSDDVFLDNPDPPVVSTVGDGTSSHHLMSHRDIDVGSGSYAEHITRQAAGNEDSEYINSMDQHVVESLRKNSLQSKLRQTWRHRRHKGPPDDHAAARPHQQEAAATQASNITQELLPQTPADEEDAAAETTPSFYYVISPTDDVNMPDVIAVRKSSVELIRWQNSLRRRRRRQAKRHDLGRGRRNEPNGQSGTV